MKRQRLLSPGAPATIALSLDGRWTAEDFAQLCGSTDDLYNLICLTAASSLRRQAVKDAVFPIDRRSIRIAARQFTPFPAVAISSIRYASPGKLDFIGTGEAVRQFRILILAVIDRFLQSRTRNLQIRVHETELTRLQEQARFEKRQNNLRLRELGLEIGRKEDQRKLQAAMREEDLRSLRLTNTERELLLAAELRETLGSNRLSPDEKRQLLHWIGTRTGPLSRLVNEGKLSRPDDQTSGS